MFNFEELNEATRQAMLREFDAEQEGTPYVSTQLSSQGVGVYAELMRNAICTGNEVSLEVDLSYDAYWRPTGSNRSRSPSRRTTNGFSYKAKRLAITEFNTWNVRGLARLLLDEGVETCEVYRADSAGEPRDECLEHEGKQFSVQEIYEGHRARYWPRPGNPSALSVPTGPNCHHTIRRAKGDS